MKGLLVLNAALLLAVALSPVSPPLLRAVETSPAAGSYAVRRAESTAAFTVKKWGVLNVTGRFPDVTGSIQLDRRAPEASRVVLRIGVASVDTGEPARDETLRSEDFFDARRYPEMTFVSARVLPQGDDSALVIGDLTIRGVTKRITVPVKLMGLTEENGRQLAGFEAAFTVDRREFGVLGSRWSGGRSLIGNDVTVQLTIGAARGPR